MATAHYVKKARRSYRGTGIRKGDPYWWWQFRFCGKSRSRTRPKQSQLTRSPFWQQVYAIQEGAEDAPESREDLAGRVEGLLTELGELRDETQEKVDNVPENLQDSCVHELLTGRVEALEQAVSDLEGVDTDDEDTENAWGQATAAQDLGCE